MIRAPSNSASASITAARLLSPQSVKHSSNVMPRSIDKLRNSASSQACGDNACTRTRNACAMLEGKSPASMLAGSDHAPDR